MIKGAAFIPMCKFVGFIKDLHRIARHDGFGLESASHILKDRHSLVSRGSVSGSPVAYFLRPFSRKILKLRVKIASKPANQRVPEELSGAPPKRLISQSNKRLEKSPRTSLARSGFVEKAGCVWTRRFESCWAWVGWSFVRITSTNFGRVSGYANFASDFSSAPRLCQYGAKNAVERENAVD